MKHVKLFEDFNAYSKYELIKKLPLVKKGSFEVNDRGEFVAVVKALMYDGFNFWLAKEPDMNNLEKSAEDIIDNWIEIDNKQMPVSKPKKTELEFPIFVTWRIQDNLDRDLYRAKSVADDETKIFHFDDYFSHTHEQRGRDLRKKYRI